MRRVIWVAPNYNHYKRQFLARLASDDLNITVLAGRSQKASGYVDAREADPVRHLTVVEVPCTKQQFGTKWVAYSALLKHVRSQAPDHVLMPAERKFMGLIIFAFLLKLWFRFRLVSYNHPLVGKHIKQAGPLDRLLSRLIFSLYDRVIFYTEQSRDWAVKNLSLNRTKTGYASNTLAVASDALDDHVPGYDTTRPVILFIGRLVPIKGLDVLLDYFEAVQKTLPAAELVIIGDGPERPLVEAAVARNSSIHWRGALVDEPAIAEQMKDARCVFIPGASGLSVMHAFAYGKPYLTLGDDDILHGPEIDYLKDGINGYLLSGYFEDNTAKIAALLNKPQLYNDLSQHARATAKAHSIELWCKMMKQNLQ